ncbi:MAG: hypothetical protein SF029_10485 [bacterium]|nr:hypothetical protein [bacterium]
MSSIFNQYSFLFLSVSVGVLLALVIRTWWKPRLLVGAAVLSIYALVVILILVTVRFPAGNAPRDTLASIESTLTDGRPTFVMLYSHFCLNCIRALPAVRELDDQLTGQGVEIDELLLDIHSEVGRAARERFSFRYTPTYLLFDGAGNELLRSNQLFTLDEMRVALREAENETQ